MTQHRQQRNDELHSDGADAAIPRWSPVKRWLLVFTILVVLALVLIKVCLPAVVERMICDKIEAAGLNDAELRVTKVGLTSTLIELASVSDQHWSTSASRVLVKYAPLDLMAGKLEAILIEGMKVDLKLPDTATSGSYVDLDWIYDVANLIENFGVVRAHGLILSVERDAQSVAKVIDVELGSHRSKGASAVVSAADFKLHVDLHHVGTHAELSFDWHDVEPDALMSTLDIALGRDQSLLPQGFSMSGANLSGSLSVDKGNLSPVEISVDIQGLVYEQVDLPLKIRVDEAKMKLSTELSKAVNTEVRGTAHGIGLSVQKGGHELSINDASMVFDINDGHLAAEASLKIGGNEIPVAYWHKFNDEYGGWELDGGIEVEEAHLRTPWEDATMLVDGMEGKSVSGKFSVKMNFSLAKDRAMQATLSGSLSEGAISLINQEPFLEGIEADIQMDSLMLKSTADFHRVTARKAIAFDVTMKDLAMDYKLLESGDVSVRDARFNAMGGEVLIDDFVLPEGDADYAFIMRFKKLDLALLADLFPSFSGRISGSVDGLLPIEKRQGEITPGRGVMYLTPGTKGKLCYDAGDSFSAGLAPNSEQYRRMKMVEQSLQDLELKVLHVRLFDPSDQDKAIVLRLEGHAPQVEGSPPIHLNVHGFKPDDEAVDFFELLLRHRDRLNFGL
ncbi:MAG: intermembrane phospholipid transport protein YdbH family protein [Akkermansiaceae bacterium]